MTAQSLQRAAAALQGGDFTGALNILQPLMREQPNSADVWQLAALAYKGIADIDAAEVAFLRALELAPAQPHVITNLANLYRQSQRLPEAITRYKEALKMQANNLPARVNLGRSLMDVGDYTAAETEFSQVLALKPDHINATIGLAQTLQHQGDQAGALGLFQQVLNVEPNNAPALNGLGNGLKVLGWTDPAVDALWQAARLAPHSAGVHANLASALAQAGREEEAVAAYEQALAIEPDNPELHQWFNGYLDVIEHSSYLDSYRRRLAERTAGEPDNSHLAIPLARKLLLRGQEDEAQLVLAEALASTADVIATSALNAELSYVSREAGHFDAAVVAAERAVALAPNDAVARRELANALMAAGTDYSRAVMLLEALLQEHPESQGLWALYGTALRYAGETTAYRRLFDYQRLVNVRAIAAPDGFGSVSVFIAALRATLLGLHNTRRHPSEQSLVNGTQTLDDLLSRQDEHIQLLGDALHEQLLDIVTQLPSDATHPLLKRNTGALHFSDSWSVKLRRRGFHKNHFHSSGWLSSAFYLAVPELVNAGRGEGWIKFGEPGFRAREPLPAEFWIKPRVGQLVVFPSYMWHGTEPLSEDVERMTVGYDILPS